MKTKTVKAVDMLDAKTPFIFKGRAGLYSVTRTAIANGRVRFCVPSADGRETQIASRALNEDVEILVEEVNQNADHLLDTIGALHTRNKGLQKGHATLTRRVQELEAELALTKQQVLAASGTSFTVAGGQVFIEEALIAHPNRRLSDRAVDAIIADVMKPIVKKASDRCLQDVVNARHVREAPTAADLKLQADLKAVTESVKAVGEAVHIIAERMLQPGGLLYRSLK